MQCPTEHAGSPGETEGGVANAAAGWFGGSEGFGCAPALCHNGHSHHQAKQGTLEPHLDNASLLGPCSWVCSACDIFQAGLWHQCCRADKLLSFDFIYATLDMNSLPCPLLHIVSHCHTLQHCSPNSGLPNECTGKGTALIQPHFKNGIRFH